MPIFDFMCSNCKKVKEVITLNATKQEKVICECGNEMNKLLSNEFGFRLMGECWHKDGYKYEYTNCKAGPPKVPCIHGRKTIDKKLKSMTAHREKGEE